MQKKCRKLFTRSKNISPKNKKDLGVAYHSPPFEKVKKQVVFLRFMAMVYESVGLVHCLYVMTTMCTVSWISPFSVDWSHARRVAVHPNLVEPGVLHFTSIVSGLILPLPPLLHWCTWLHLVLYFTIFPFHFIKPLAQY